MQFINRFVFCFLVFMMSAAVAWADDRGYQLVVGKDHKFCTRVLGAFREDVDDRWRPRYQHEMFRQITWKPVDLSGQGPKTRHCSSLDKTIVDLDNDGRPDLVVRTTFCMKGSPSDSFYMFPTESRVLEQANWQDLSPLLATPDKFERTGGRYSLTALPISSESKKEPPALNTVFMVHPFIMDEKTYVALTDGLGQWVVIAKYLRGERFEDQCYLHMATR